ncbi:hypothetical protein DFH06DRAFT_364429 [Mycena polygramma]|nr:hypothetical protein DFH06DRAFT_364429 [Mycena polygramma]
MNLYLVIFTHLCAHLLGLMGNSALTFIFAIVAVLVYWIHLILLRAFWPGRLLHDTLTRIEAMETQLHDEARRRRTMEMYNLSTYGLRGLSVLKHVHDSVADDHQAHLHVPLYYLPVALSLYQRARRCKKDVEVLCHELHTKIQRFDNGHQDNDDDNPDPDSSQTQTSWNDWLDMIVGSLFNQLGPR